MAQPTPKRYFSTLERAIREGCLTITRSWKPNIQHDCQPVSTVSYSRTLTHKSLLPATRDNAFQQKPRMHSVLPENLIAADGLQAQKPKGVFSNLTQIRKSIQQSRSRLIQSARLRSGLDYQKADKFTPKPIQLLKPQITQKSKPMLIVPCVPITIDQAPQESACCSNGHFVVQKQNLKSTKLKAHSVRLTRSTLLGLVKSRKIRNQQALIELRVLQGTNEVFKVNDQ